jgi:hypothetical protein
MKIAHIGCFNRYHTEADICDYLEFAGHRVDRYQFDRLDQQRFVARANRFDIVICSIPHTFSPEWWRDVRQRGPRLVAWYFDWIADWGGREAQYLPRLREFDLILSTDGFENKIYDGLNRHWLPHACDPRVYYPIDERPASDVGFIGHVYLPRRKFMLERLMKRYNFSVMGLLDNCWGPNYARACASVKIMLGDNFRNDIPGYWSDRVYMSLACGAFYLSPRVPGLERYFKEGCHIAYYDDENDLYEKIDYYLARPEERNSIARAGADYVAHFQNWKVRIEEAWKCVSGL